MATIAILAHRAPYPLTGGGRIRTNRLVRGLKDEFEVIFVTLAHGWEEPVWTQADLERTLGVEVIVVSPGVPRDEPRHIGRLMRHYHRREATQVLTELVAQRNVRLIQYEFAYAAQNGPVAGAMNVLDAHNVEHRVPQQLAAAVEEREGRASAEREWRELRDAEHTIWRTMDMCLAVSELDAQTMRAAGARRVVSCPNGADPVPPLSRIANGHGPLRALFVGMGDYEPYERGLAWFVHEVLPIARERHPVRLDVVGRRPRRPVHADGVTYTGEVETLEAYYRDAEVVVVPVFHASGTRIKVIEAMRYGRPVVSTSVGVEGLPLEPGRHFALADDASAFASAIIDLATRSRHRDLALEEMVDSAREAIAPLSWPQIAASLGDLYRRELRCR